MRIGRLWTAVLLLCGAAWAADASLVMNNNAPWQYFKGVSEASNPRSAWRGLLFNDSAWTPGPAPFWYGDVQTGGTQLTDMQNSYTTVFLRRTFIVNNLADFTTLQITTRCDDGYIAWINGSEVARFNVPAGDLAFNASASGAIAEPTTNYTVNLPTPTSYLVTGTNVFAVQIFNAGAGSSDLGFDITLSNGAADTAAPIVYGVSPAPGTVNGLTQVTVRFDEPVQGINASDFLINGTPASGMTGGSEIYTFTFGQPALGMVNISWAGSHGITDVAAPTHPFNAVGPGATWSYNLVDTTPPAVSFQLPFAGVTVRSLTQIEVFFTEPVIGVNAGDLKINGAQATSLTAGSASNYVFQFAQPMPGPVNVTWDFGHGISDLAMPPNLFTGPGWSYVLDPNAVVTSVRINELLTANIGGLRDEDNEPQDWVELFNTSSNAVSLAAWSLTDDENDPEKWIFPNVVIGPRSYLIVFCSGKDRKPVTPGSRLHTNFKLDPEGEYLALYNAEVPRAAVSVFNPYPNQRRDISYGYDPLDQFRYFQTPTPGTNNPASSITGVVSDTKFSHDRGFYTAQFTLTITSATPGVTIRYTRDGSAPTETVGTLYSGGIQVTGTTTLRAIAYKTGLLSSDVDCHTYLFLGDVILQSASSGNNGTPPPGWPASWSPNTTDYGMDPEIVNAAPWNTTIQDDLKAIPTFSIVMSLTDFFGGTGIYSNPGGDGLPWERPASIELIYPDDSQGFQINCGIRVRGGFSRSTDNPKHAFRFFFRQEYGASKLNYPFFGVGGATSFDKFDMRTMQNYSWAFQNDSRMMCLRDVMARDQQMAMSGNATRGHFYHLYVNGQYWGLFNSEERPEAAFGESYYGGQAEDYDTIKIDPDNGYNIEATDGNTAAWLRLWQAATNGFVSDADYFRVQGLNLDGTPNPAYENLLDVDNLIDYMLIILYGGNLDAPISNFLGNTSPNNWYGFRNRDGLRGGFRFWAHDSEHTLLNSSEDRTGPYPAGDPANGSSFAKSNPQYLWQRLQANAEFRIRVSDRVQRACFNGGALSIEGARVLLNIRSNEIQRAIVAESARWGDAKTGGAPYTRNTWVGAMNGVSGFINARLSVFLNQLRTDSLFPSVNAPIFSANGGAVSNGYSLYMTNNNAGGTIYYTVNGSDPRLRGGNVSPAAIAYVAGTPIVINFPTVVRARVRNGTTWSAITEATFYPGQDFHRLLVTEIMYHPPDLGVIPDDEFEFLELKNASANVLDFTGVYFSDGITFAFTNGTRLAAGQFFLLGRNRTQLTNKYPGLVVHGLYTDKLNNGGETLTLKSALGSRLLEVDYKDGGRWPLTPDGHGFSLVPRDPNTTANPNNPSTWRASTNPGGSPGADDPAPTLPGILVNEALTHTDLPAVDFIELHNPTAGDVNIGGWFLTDDASVPKKFRIPDGLVIPMGGYRLFTETNFNPTPGTNNSFSLSSRGESVYLLSGDAGTNLTGYSHGFSFGAASNGVSFGRHVLSTGDEHFVAQISQTPEAANSGPLVGPVDVRQIMYHPPDLPGGLDNQDDEYVELRNVSGGAVRLFDSNFPTNKWRIRGGADYDFPYGVTLAPSASLVLVSFDPADAVKLAAFRSKYGGFGATPVYGPYSGKLDNSSDEVEIQRPDAPDALGTPFIVVDRVDYRDAAPWPPSADGSGAVLQRVSLSAYGDDPLNWVGYAPLTIVNPPQTWTVKAGTSPATATNVTFTVDAIGAGALSYQWRRDGTNMPGATTDAYTVLDVQLDDEGAYSVTVSDLTGSVESAPGYLYVQAPAAFIEGPLNISAVYGEDFTVSASVSGGPPPSYSWFRVTPLTPLFYTNTGLRTTFATFNTAALGLTVPAGALSTNYNLRLVISNVVSSGQGLARQFTLTVLADSDNDGVPDLWETAYGFNPALDTDGALDQDGDGLSNEEEYLAGTNPTNEASCLKIVQTITPGLPTLLSFEAQSNRTYQVEYASSLPGPWFKLAELLARPNVHMESVPDPAWTSNRFYRVRTPQKP